MKHAKRMILVPEDVLNRYEQKQKIETSPITSHMMHQDTAIKLKWTVKRFLIRIYRIWSVMPCVHVRILIPRERRNSFAGCQRLMYPKILQETRKDGIRFKWAVRPARKRLFLRHRHRDYRHQHHHVQVSRNISVVYS